MLFIAASSKMASEQLIAKVPWALKPKMSSVTHFLQGRATYAGANPSQEALPAEDQVFEHLRLCGTFHSQPTTEDLVDQLQVITSQSHF